MAEALSTAVRLGDRYRDEIRPALQEQLGLANVMQVPELVKIVVNMGVGLAAQQAKQLDGALADLEIITGQKPKITRAKKSISNFKLREGQAIGAMVTLRGVRMYEFLDRLMNLAIPRIRDFRGLNNRSFDGRGNYTFGVTEQLIFPEIDYDTVDATRGMDITIVTSADSDEAGRALLDAFGFPFRREGREWRKRHSSTSSRRRPSSRCAPTPAAAVVVGRVPCTGRSTCAGFACGRWPMPERSPAW